MSMLGDGGVITEPMGRWQGESGFLLSHSASSLSLPPELDIRTSIMPPPFRVLPSSTTYSDIILLAEFSEIEGPMPLLTIPSSPQTNLDLNDFVVKVMSTDYQNTGGEFHISNDTQLIQLDIEPGIHVYVHYFTLHDVRARGFVRPMCLAYISSDSRKLLHYFDNLRKQFSKVTNYLKISNHKWFLSEMEDLVCDLEYTKQRYIQLHRHDQLDLNQVCPLEESSENVTNVFTSGPASLAFDAMEITNMNLNINNKPTKEGGGTCDLSEDNNELGKERKNVLDSDSYANNIKNILVEDNNVNYNYSNNIYEENKVNTDLNSKINMKIKYTSHSKSNDENKICDSETMLNTNFNIEVHNSKTSESHEESLLRQTTLEAVANQLLDCHQIVYTVKAYVDQEDKDSFIDHLLKEVESQPKSPLYQCLITLDILPRRRAEDRSLYKPNVRLMSYTKRQCPVMRSLADMCSIGHVSAIIKLRSIYQFFSRSTITLMFEMVDTNFQDNPSGSLFIGNLPVINIMKQQKQHLQDSQNHNFTESLYSSACWDIELASTLCPSNFTISTESQSRGSIEFGKSSDISPGSDCLEVFPLPLELADTENCYHDKSDRLKEINIHENFQAIQREIIATSSVQGDNDGYSPHNQLSSSSNSSTWSSSAAVPLDLASFEEVEEEEGVEEEVIKALLNRTDHSYLDIDQRMIISKGRRLSGLIQQFCGVSHCLVHSVLSGRPVILAGAEPFRQLVGIYVKALASLLPRKAHQPAPVLKWHMGTITPHHLETYQIMGVAIPERLHVQDLMSNLTLNRVTVLNIETGHISGVAYGGTLVRGVEQYGRRYFRSDASLQTAMQSMLITAGIKVYLLSHLQQTTNRSSADILKACGVAKGDWDIVKYLSSLIEIEVMA